jgi:hypothetical protein
MGDYEIALERYRDSVERLKVWMENRRMRGWDQEEWIEYLRLSLAVILSGLECRDALVSLEHLEACRGSN